MRSTVRWERQRWMECNAEPVREWEDVRQDSVPRKPWKSLQGNLDATSVRLRKKAEIQDS